MQGTWVREPHLTKPYSLNSVNMVGPDTLAGYYWFELAATGTISGTIRCFQGQLKEAVVTVDFKVMLPQSVPEMAMGAAMARGAWLKSFWWANKGQMIISSALERHEQVKTIIKALVESRDDICRGTDTTVRRREVLQEPIWLDQNLNPMLIPPGSRAQLRVKPRTRVA